MERVIDLGGIVTDFAMTGQHFDCIFGRELVKLHKSTGDIVLRRAVFPKDGLSRKLIAHNGELFIYDFCTLHIFRQDDFEPLGSWRLGEDLTSDICGMAVDEDLVYCSIRNGKLIALDRESRRLREAGDLGSSMWSVRSYGPHLICGTVDGRLLLIGKYSLAVEKEIVLGKKNIASLLIDGDIVYAAGQDGRLSKISLDGPQVLARRSSAHRKMFRFAGMYRGRLVTVSHPGSEIAFWDAGTLERTGLVETPLKLSGRALIDGDSLYISSRNIPGIDMLRLDESI